MSDQNEPIPPNNKVYGSYKVSEYSHGKGRYVIDEPEIEERKKQKDEFI